MGVLKRPAAQRRRVTAAVWKSRDRARDKTTCAANGPATSRTSSLPRTQTLLGRTADRLETVTDEDTEIAFGAGDDQVRHVLEVSREVVRALCSTS